MGTVDFAGQHAVVTGASSGIGRAIALALAAEHADVSLVARDPVRLQRVAADASEHGIRATSHVVDLCVEEELRRWADACTDGADGVDILVHSAGVHSLGLVAEAPVEDLDRLYATNVRAQFLLTQLLLPSLLARQGQIVFVNSSAALGGRANLAQYAATQHARRALADCLREEINPRGVRVLSVYPGRTATPLQEKLHVLEGRRYSPDALLQPSDVAATVVAALSLPRTAEVTNIEIRPMRKPTPMA